MSVKEQMTQARQLIMDKRFEEARRILNQVDHPVAQEWLAKLDQIAPQTKQSPQPAPEPIFASDAAPSALPKRNINKEYGLNSGEVMKRVFFGLLGIPMVILVFVYFFPREFTLDGATLFRAGMPILILLGLLMVAGPALSALMGDRKTILRPEGVVRSSLLGTKFHTWEEIEAIKGGFTDHRTSGFTMYTSGTYDVYSNGKVVFQITNLDQNAHDLYRLVTQQIVATHKSKLLARLRNGDVIKFEKMEIHQDGLHFGGDYLPLNDIGDVQINNRVVFINRANGKVWRRFMIEQAYNPFLFMEVVNTLARRK